VDAVHPIHNNPVAMWYVYLLKCCDGTVYTGCTNNLDDRLHRHQRGEIHYTKTRLPVELVTYIAFSDKYKAYDFEKYLKSGSGKAFSQKRLI
jgi:predicted GIY-YIG superfamily endonuclease